MKKIILLLLLSAVLAQGIEDVAMCDDLGQSYSCLQTQFIEVNVEVSEMKCVNSPFIEGCLGKAKTLNAVDYESCKMIVPKDFTVEGVKRDQNCRTQTLPANTELNVLAELGTIPNCVEVNDFEKKCSLEGTYSINGGLTFEEGEYYLQMGEIKETTVIPWYLIVILVVVAGIAIMFFRKRH